MGPQIARIRLLILAAILALLPVAHAAAGEVILFRGGLNAFSLGLDDVAKALEAEGIPAKPIGFRRRPVIEAGIIDEAGDGDARQPVILVGHSWGAQAALLMAAALKDHDIRVDLIVTLDPLADIRASANVDKVINIYVDRSGVPIKPGGGFRGAIENIEAGEIDESIIHMEIDEHPEVHDLIVAAVKQVWR